MSRRAIVIVGAGHAGVQAAASLREEGGDDAIVLVSGEPHLPYSARRCRRRSSRARWTSPAWR